ncbi:uncharacterized protein EI90DRAFT_3121020 [Cantharellus anzutake]|uniref:uncharacterized protein n=1 Tax=Cantharellus anzutake TaxID=1750568 RepID=UPI0019069D53|nr:uncharacterized protein EI90DRAFT_3121020 [Cantharellus anzutake]KAF8334609.1 hypothetical protein EI90DRAFT_3121020 [Cantharellus anzutake]
MAGDGYDKYAGDVWSSEEVMNKYAPKQDPKDIWALLSKTSPLWRLADTVLSFVCNAADSEWLWSHCGLIKSKKRSRLSVEKMKKTVIKIDLMSKRAMDGSRIKWIKRTHGVMATEEDIAQSQNRLGEEALDGLGEGLSELALPTQPDHYPQTGMGICYISFLSEEDNFLLSLPLAAQLESPSQSALPGSPIETDPVPLSLSSSEGSGSLDLESKQLGTLTGTK